MWFDHRLSQYRIGSISTHIGDLLENISDPRYKMLILQHRYGFPSRMFDQQCRSLPSECIDEFIRSKLDLGCKVSAYLHRNEIVGHKFDRGYTGFISGCTDASQESIPDLNYKKWIY